MRLSRRRLSTQMVEAGDDYFCWVKENQPTLLADLELLFGDEYVCAGWSAPPVDFTTAASIEKGHGRLEQRVLTASSLLAGYHDWPYLAQVVKMAIDYAPGPGRSVTCANASLTRS